MPSIAGHAGGAPPGAPRGETAPATPSPGPPLVLPAPSPPPWAGVQAPLCCLQPWRVFSSFSIPYPRGGDCGDRGGSRFGGGTQPPTPPNSSSSPLLSVSVGPQLSGGSPNVGTPHLGVHGVLPPPKLTVLPPPSTCSPGGQWQCEDNACLVDGDLIDAINGGNFGWRAGNYSQFWGMTLEEGIRYRLGTFRPPPTVMNMNEMHVPMDSNEVLPPHFDAATKWPGMIHEPLDQGNCAGSWAFSTAAVASDRISIHSMGHMTPSLSPQNLLSCDTRNQRGCSGGRLDGAWWYLRRRGVVTDECYPFTSPDSQPAAPPCMMHSRSTGRGKRQATARCPNPQTHANDIYQSTPAYRLASSEKEIMKELMENGPVQAILEVHEDFFLYRSGIYRHTPVAEGKGPKHQRHGTHSVKITGWGEEQLPDGQTLKYWTAANSWGRAWGEDGRFRIARGVNECEVESFVLGVWGRVGVEDMPHK